MRWWHEVHRYWPWVIVEPNKAEPWKDKSIPSNPASPMRGHMKFSWFVAMGKVGRNGAAFGVGREKRIKATESGRLYLYVNGAIPPLCVGGCLFFHDNNEGAAKVTVERLAE